MKNKKKPAILILLLLGVAGLYAQTGLEVMTQNNEQVYADDETFNITMTLVNKKGKQRARKIKQVLKNDENQNRSSLITFLSPANVRGTGFLSIEYSEKEDGQWLYLPALKRSRRISSSDNTDNFVGSDFTYEDLDTEDIEQFAYQITGSKTINDLEHFVIEAIPNNEKKRKESGYSKRIIYVRKDNFMISKIQFFNKKGVLFKELNASEMTFLEDVGKWRSAKINMHNLKTGHRTILEFSNILVNKGNNNRLFTKRNLEKGA